MLIADTVVHSVPLGIEPFQLSSLTHTAVATTLTWPGQKGFDYQIEYSSDLIDWRRDLTLLNLTPTWRANPDRFAASAFAGRDINGDAVRFAEPLRPARAGRMLWHGFLTHRGAGRKFGQFAP